MYGPYVHDNLIQNIALDSGKAEPWFLRPLTKRSVFSRYFFQNGLIFRCPPMSQTLSFMPWEATLFMLKPWGRAQRRCHCCARWWWWRNDTKCLCPSACAAFIAGYFALCTSYISDGDIFGYKTTFFCSQRGCIRSLSRGSLEEQIWG